MRVTRAQAARQGSSETFRREQRYQRREAARQAQQRQQRQQPTRQTLPGRRQPANESTIDERVRRFQEMIQQPSRRTNTYRVNGITFSVTINGIANNLLVDITAFNISAPERYSIAEVQRIITTKLISIGYNHFRRAVNTSVTIEYTVEDDRDVMGAEFTITRTTDNKKVYPSDDPYKKIINELDTILDEEKNRVIPRNATGTSKDHLVPLNIVSILLNISKLTETDGGKYTDELEMLITQRLSRKRINSLYIPQNLDNNRCFDYAIALLLEDRLEKKVRDRMDLNRQSLKKYLDMYDFSKLYNIDGFQLKNLPKAEEILQTNILVYTIDENDEIIKYYSNHILYPNEKPFHLFIMPRDYSDNDSIYKNSFVHFCAINNLTGFIHNKSRDRNTTCDWCMKIFSSKNKYDTHLHACKQWFQSDLTRNLYNSKIELPEAGTTLTFKKVWMRSKMIFTAYSDFETSPNPKTGAHEAVSYAIVFMENKKVHSRILRASHNSEELAVQWWRDIEKFRHYATERLQKYKTFEGTIPIMKPDAKCCLCLQKIEEPVYHHCHYSGDGVGWACKSCNSSEAKSKQMSVYFHNLAYDSKLIIRHLYEPHYYKNQIYKNDYRAVCKSSQKISSLCMTSKRIFTGYDENKKPHYDFLIPVNIFDSYAHVSTTLEKAADDLKKSKVNKFVHSTQFFNEFYCKLETGTVSNAPGFEKTAQLEDKYLLDAFTSKGVFPYQAFTHDLLESRGLPPIEDFHNSLAVSNLEGATDKDSIFNTLGRCKTEDYEHATRIYESLQNIYKEKTKFKHYHDFYLWSDVHLLTDIFENYRDFCYEEFGIDPAYSQTLPSFSKEANYIVQIREKIEPVVLLGPEQENLYKTLQDSITGGYSGIGVRRAESGHNKALIYIDQSALYNNAMSQLLPVKYLETITENTIDYYNSFNEVDNKVLIIEVDIDYYNTESNGYKIDEAKFNQIKHRFRNYPPFPTNMKINEAELSDYQLEMGKPGNSKKLVMSFKKKSIVTDYRLLKFFTDLDAVRILNIKAIHVFKGSYLLEPFVRECREIRKRALKDKRKADADQAKLFSNSLYGKNLENKIRNSECEFVYASDCKAVLRKNNSPFFKDRMILSNDTALYSMTPKKLFLNVPIFIGHTILSLSKLIINNMIHHQIHTFNEKYGLKNETLLMTDTDSYAFSIELNEQVPTVSDYLGKLHEMHQCVDFSSWPEGHPNRFDIKDHPLNCENFCKKPGTVGSEFAPSYLGQPEEEWCPNEFYGIKAKQYCFWNSKTNKGIVKSKGVPSGVVKRLLKAETFKKIVKREIKEEKAEFYAIKSDENRMKTRKEVKKLIDGYDDKLFFENDYSFRYFE